MKRILIPVDFSKHSEYALNVASSIAKEHKAEIVVVHMLGLSEAIINKDDSVDSMQAMYYMKLTQIRFADFLDKDYLKGIKVTEIVHNYKVFSELNDVAKDNKADLIVMGSHGTSGLSEVFVGSNTEKVVRTSDIPVLVVKKPIKNFKLKNVVMTCDFENENVESYRKAMKLFELFNAKVHLLYVNLPSERFRSSDQIEEKAREFILLADNGNLDNLSKVIYRNNYSIEEGIFTYCNKVKADVIAVTTHGRKGLAHFFFGSVGEDIANHSDIPVLTLKI